MVIIYRITYFFKKFNKKMLIFGKNMFFVIFLRLIIRDSAEKNILVILRRVVAVKISKYLIWLENIFSPLCVIYEIFTGISLTFNPSR